MQLEPYLSFARTDSLFLRRVENDDRSGVPARRVSLRANLRQRCAVVKNDGAGMRPSRITAIEARRGAHRRTVTLLRDQRASRAAT